MEEVGGSDSIGVQGWVCLLELESGADKLSEPLSVSQTVYEQEP
jgi:hypothetical protein